MSLFCDWYTYVHFFLWQRLRWGEVRKQIRGGKSPRLCSLIWGIRTSHSHVFYPVSRGRPTERCGESRWGNLIVELRLHQPHEFSLFASVSVSLLDSILIMQYSIFAKHTEVRIIAELTTEDPHQRKDFSGLRKVEATVTGSCDLVLPAPHPPLPLTLAGAIILKYKYEPFTASYCPQNKARTP